MNRHVEDLICRATGADGVFHREDIQSLWSGYGKIIRYGLHYGLRSDLKEGDCRSIVVKHVKLPDQRDHPRGWNTDFSHQRKVTSYQVESAWYRDWSAACDACCRVPRCFVLESGDNEFLMVLEDLDASGFSVRKTSVSITEMQACLAWLAHFHATFMGQTPSELWRVGTYWHLDTRPDELAVLEDTKLKQAAAHIDQRLRTSHYQSFVHGDAKLANFCFSDTDTSKASAQATGIPAKGIQVAAVDFQYVGGGCGMKDVAYFIGSCLHEADCERYEAVLLDSYFSQLGEALKMRSGTIDIADVEREWRSLYPLAWTDFHRFVKGWSPGHWKIHGYSERIAREVLAQLDESLR